MPPKYPATNVCVLWDLETHDPLIAIQYEEADGKEMILPLGVTGGQRLMHALALVYTWVCQADQTYHQIIDAGRSDDAANEAVRAFLDMMFHSIGRPSGTDAVSDHRHTIVYQFYDPLPLDERLAIQEEVDDYPV